VLCLVGCGFVCCGCLWFCCVVFVCVCSWFCDVVVCLLCGVMCVVWCVVCCVATIVFSDLLGRFGLERSSGRMLSEWLRSSFGAVERSLATTPCSANAFTSPRPSPRQAWSQAGPAQWEQLPSVYFPWQAWSQAFHFSSPWPFSSVPSCGGLDLCHLI
jgi:hypothetical protein